MSAATKTRKPLRHVYNQRAADVEALIEQLTNAVVDHDAGERIDWGYVGDLGYVREKLIELVDHMRPALTKKSIKAVLNMD